MPDCWVAHQELEPGLLGVRLFRVERNAHGDFITHVRHVLDDAEVRTLDDGRRVETRCLAFDHPGISKMPILNRRLRQAKLWAQHFVYPGWLQSENCI